MQYNIYKQYTKYCQFNEQYTYLTIKANHLEVHPVKDILA
jgi:hypothetical protein